MRLEMPCQRCMGKDAGCQLCEDGRLKLDVCCIGDQLVVCYVKEKALYKYHIFFLGTLECRRYRYLAFTEDHKIQLGYLFPGKVYGTMIPVTSLPENHLIF